MKTNYISLKPDRLDLPLAPCSIGKLSSAVLTIGGDIPDDISGLVVKIEYMNGSAKATYTAVATRRDSAADYRCYLAPTYFPDTSDKLNYHIVGLDDNNNPRWLGTGTLRIFDNPANGSGAVPDILPRNLYAYNPTTGLYYKIVAELNEHGQVSVAVDQEGVEL